MIYLRNNTNPQVMYVPRNGQDIEGTLVFKAVSDMELDMKIEEEFEDVQLTDRYAVITISLPAGLPDGEYEYTLTDGADIVSTGLLVIGEEETADQYEKEITYEQYITE